jgi:dTDP-4-amino-4,6-dideoxygalactose transaminase
VIKFPHAEEPIPFGSFGMHLTPWHPASDQTPDPPRISVSKGHPAVPGQRDHVPILESGWMTNGPEVAAFEREFAAHVGARCAVAVSSGAAAVELSLRAMRLTRGSRVLLPTLAPYGVVQAIVRAGLRPVLLDVSDVTGMPTAQNVRDAARPFGKPASAMLVVHWGGDPADVEELAEVAGLSSDVVIEDASQALGASWNAVAVGGTGSACFSFCSTATMPIGDGGMVTTDDPERAGRLMVARVRGTSGAARRHVQRRHIGPHILREGGLQSSLTEQSAATGRAQLRRLTAPQLRRKELATRYDERLAGIPDLGLPHRPAEAAGEHSWQYYAVRVDRPTYTRDGVVRSLAAAGIGTTYVTPPLHHLAYCRDVSELPEGGLPGADRLIDQLISLPIHPRLADSAVDRVSEVLQATLGRTSVRSSERTPERTSGSH